MSAITSVNDINFTPGGALQPSPADWRDHAIYFLLVDRFDNNDPAVPAYAGNAPPVAADSDAGRRFQGGNIKGITRRLDYLRNLGCGAVWLSPILKNRQDSNDSYHGYGIQNFLEVDPRFGSLADLQELSRELHARGMYLILDVVINHAGDVWAYPDDQPYYYYRNQTFPFGFWRERDPAAGLDIEDGVWPRELQAANAFKRRGQIRNWYDADEARNGDFLSLKELNLPDPPTLDALIKIYKYWIMAADLDGFRIDTVKHIEDSATAIFCNAIREYALRIGKRNFFLFGEIVADDGFIQSYLGRNARIEGTNERFPSLDAALDFPLYFMLEEVIKGFTNPAALRARYDAFHERYADHSAASCYFVTFVDNHDQMARPYRRLLHNDPHWRQAVLAIGYLLTSQGVPCIYYGTERGFDGGGDNDMFVRECMFGGSWGGFRTTGHHFFNEQHDIYRAIQRLTAVRREQAPLRYGRQYFREISGNGNDFGHPLDGRCTLAYSRILDSDEVLVALNLDAGPRADYITVDTHLSAARGHMTDLLDPQRQATVERRDGRACVRVPLPGHGLAIMKRTDA